MIFDSAAAAKHTPCVLPHTQFSKFDNPRLKTARRFSTPSMEPTYLSGARPMPTLATGKTVWNLERATSGQARNYGETQVTSRCVVIMIYFLPSPQTRLILVLLELASIPIPAPTRLAPTPGPGESFSSPPSRPTAAPARSALLTGVPRIPRSLLPVSPSSTTDARPLSLQIV
jgi:hypothetical protein